jgi:hypothetical protein
MGLLECRQITGEGKTIGSPPRCLERETLKIASWRAEGVR